MVKTCKIIHVDFGTGSIKNVENISSCGKYNFSNFKDVPESSRYFGISDAERYGISESIIQAADGYDFLDLLYFASEGVLDCVKISEELGLGFDKENFGTTIA